ESDREHTAGVVDRPRDIQGLALGVEHGEHRRPLEPAQGLRKHVALHSFHAASKDGEHGTTGRAGDHGGEDDLIAYHEVAPTSAVPQALRNLAQYGGRVTPRRVEHAALAVN